MKYHENNGNNDASCSDCEKYLIALMDFIDGTLLEKDAQDLRKHLESCTECKTAYEMLQTSLGITGKLQTAKDQYLSSVTEEQRTLKIDGMKDRIHREAGLREATTAASDEKFVKHAVPSAFLLFRRRILPVAASFAVILFSMWLFLQSGMQNGSDRSNTNQTQKETAGTVSDDYALYPGNKGENANDTLEENDYGVSGAKSLYDQECATQPSDAGTAVTDSSAVCPGTASGSVSSKATTPSASSSTKGNTDIGSNYGQASCSSQYINVLMKPEISQKINDEFKKALALTVTNNTTDRFQCITAYTIEISHLQADKIRAVAEAFNLSVKIEIISGEDSQKLVEYTSEENAAQLQNKTAVVAADFLVISIGR